MHDFSWARRGQLNVWIQFMHVFSIHVNHYWVHACRVYGVLSTQITLYSHSREKSHIVCNKCFFSSLLDVTNQCYQNQIHSYLWTKLMLTDNFNICTRMHIVLWFMYALKEVPRGKAWTKKRKSTIRPMKEILYFEHYILVDCRFVYADLW